MKIFEISSIRNIIFSYVYPKKIKKGDVIKIVKSHFHPYLSGRTSSINNIVKYNDYFIIILTNESFSKDNSWYKVDTYLYSYNDDIIKVINCQ